MPGSPIVVITDAGLQYLEEFRRFNPGKAWRVLSELRDSPGGIPEYRIGRRISWGGGGREREGVLDELRGQGLIE